MKILIQGNRTISEIQKDFSDLFPFLKIEFFSKPHSSGAGSSKNSIQDHDIQLSKLGLDQREGDFEVLPEMTVSEFEQGILKFFGLSVQVFRKTDHHSWLETTDTDNWTLEKQNQTGKDWMEMRINPEKKEEIDYD